MEMRRFDVWVGRLAAAAGLVYVILCTLWPLNASADDGASTDRVASPYFFVDSDDPAVDRLPLKSTRVDVRIAGVIADVTVTQHYANQGRRPLEARYVFPGGTRAAVHAMRVRIGDRLLTADIREKRQARADYQAAKAEGRTAALLEEHRPNVFQMNVANILPGDDIAVELHYTELIVPEDGRYRFVFPTVVGPRYNGTPKSVASTAIGKWAAMPFLPSGVATSATFDLHVALASPIGVKAVSSDTHVIDVKRARDASGGSDRVDIALGEKTANDRDFILDYRLAGDAIETGVLLHQGSDENFFVAMIEPPKNVSTNVIVPREYLFVIDISGSMHGYPLDTAKALLRKLIGGLRPSDTFNVLLFSGDDSVLAPKSLPATQANIDFAVRTIDRQSGGGSTELLPALRHALALPKDDDRSRTMVVVTDGYVTVEREAFELIRHNLGRANLFAFGIGSSVNRELIEGLARAGQGEPFVVTKPGDAAMESERFRRMIDAPMLTHVKVRFEQDATAAANDFALHDVEPAVVGDPVVGDLFASRPIVVLGKWTGTRPSGRLVVEGLTANGNYRGSVDLGREGKDGMDQPALRHLWARHRIASLTDQEALEGAGAEAAAITALGLRYSLLTSYTSFVAVDRVVRNAAVSPATVDQPSPLPSGVSGFAVGAEVPTTPEPPALALLIVALAVVATLVLYRRWHDPHASLDAYRDACSLYRDASVG